MNTTIENETAEAELPASEAAAVIETLRSQASQILGSALGTTPLVGFQTGSKGNFPYTLQNPRNLEFNALNYNWINCNLKAGGGPPYQQDSGSVFTDKYIKALGSISYTLSTSDQEKLNEGQANTTEQQAAVLTQWKQAFGSIPAATDTQQPITQVLGIIASWGPEGTTLSDIKNAANLSALLSNAPAAGEPILPVLSVYLNAISSTLSLLNAVSLNNHYLNQALAAVQTPSAANGALPLDDGSLVPAYAVATQQADILNGLKADNPVKLSMSISRSSSSEYKVSITGGTSFEIPVLDFFTLGVDSSASYFKDEMASSSDSIKIDMTYTGCTHVAFGPVSYNGSTGKNWYYMQPILDAIKNADKDMSGYKFSPASTIDWTDNGSFGFLQGVAIANYPSVKITVKSSDFESIEKTFEQSTSVKMSFLGIPLGISGSESTYSHEQSSDASSGSVTITLNPPKDLVAGTAVDSAAWVLGVQTEYPAS